MPAAKNFAYSTVLTAPSPATSGGSLVVQSGDGAKFPPVPFPITIWPAGAQSTTANAEVALVTGVSTDTLTITRAQEGSSARTVVVGDQVAETMTANSAVQLNRFTPISATAQDIVLDASTNFLTPEVVEVGSANTLEVPSTSTLEVLAYSPQNIDLTTQAISNPHKFRVWRNAAANSGNGAFAVVNFDTEDYDTGNNVASGVFTVPMYGFYQFHWGSTTTTSGAELFIASLYKNGVEISRGSGVVITTASNGSHGSDQIEANKGDTFDVRIFNSATRALGVGSSFLTFFSGSLLCNK